MSQKLTQLAIAAATGALFAGIAVPFFQQAFGGTDPDAPDPVSFQQEGGSGIMTHVGDGAGSTETSAVPTVETWAHSHALVLLTAISTYERTLLVVARDLDGRAVYELEELPFVDDPLADDPVAAGLNRVKQRLAERDLDRQTDWSEALPFFVRGAAEMTGFRRIVQGMRHGQLDVYASTQDCLVLTFSRHSADDDWDQQAEALVERIQVEFPEVVPE